MFTDLLLERTRQAAGQRTVADPCLGLACTAVVPDDGNAGVACRVRSERPGCCSFLDEAVTLRGRKAREPLEGTFSGDLLRASLAVAIINALTSVRLRRPRRSFHSAPWSSRRR